jgi:aminoglycoside phosphotransferase
MTSEQNLKKWHHCDCSLGNQQWRIVQRYVRKLAASVNAATRATYFGLATSGGAEGHGGELFIGLLRFEDFNYCLRRLSERGIKSISDENRRVRWQAGKLHCGKLKSGGRKERRRLRYSCGN